MYKTIVTTKLPKVGDRLFRCISDCSCDSQYLYKPLPCRVVYVNIEHNWYKVKFDDIGIEECYGIPVFDHSIFKDANQYRLMAPVVCVETGYVYPTIKECADDMNLDEGGISSCISGRYDSISGYHFDTVL